MQAGLACMVFWAEWYYQPIRGFFSTASSIPWVV
jgi:hypothetical protein